MKQPRCRWGLKVAVENGLIATRCRLKPGHNGPHEGRHLPELPYQKIKWYDGDGRQFVTGRDILYAWRPQR